MVLDLVGLLTGDSIRSAEAVAMRVMAMTHFISLYWGSVL
jgi:hypothetical protein